MTRLRSTMSADDMTEDPLFGFRDDLPPVQSGSATRVEHCQGSIDSADDYFEGTTPEGLTARWRGRPRGLEDLPAVLRAYLRDGSGDELLVDNTDAIADGAPTVEIPEAISLDGDILCEWGRSDGRIPGGDGDADDDMSEAEGGGCRCTAGATDTRSRGLPARALIGLVGLALAVRRREQR